MSNRMVGLWGASVLACALGCSGAGGEDGASGGAAGYGTGASAGVGIGASAGSGSFAGTGAQAGSGGSAGHGAEAGSGGFGGEGAGGNGGSGGVTACAHEICQQGGPLSASCDPCVDKVCAADPYCCNAAWDAICMEEASQYCNGICGNVNLGGSGGGGFGGFGGSGGGGPCSASTCADGCCDASGACNKTHSITECGKLGAKCVDCSAMGSVCTDYQYGCAECKPDCASKACGADDGCGGICDGTCPGSEFCSTDSSKPAGCYTCGPSTCPNGCCTANGECVMGSLRKECGSGGQACSDCGSQACLSKTSFPAKFSCQPCGSTCQPTFPGSFNCQADGCGGVCPGAAVIRNGIPDRPVRLRATRARGASAAAAGAMHTSARAVVATIRAAASAASVSPATYPVSADRAE